MSQREVYRALEALGGEASTTQIQRQLGTDQIYDELKRLRKWGYVKQVKAYDPRVGRSAVWRIMESWQE